MRNNGSRFDWACWVCYDYPVGKARPGNRIPEEKQESQIKELFNGEIEYNLGWSPELFEQLHAIFKSQVESWQMVEWDRQSRWGENWPEPELELLGLN